MSAAQHKLRVVGPNAKGVNVRQFKTNRHRSLRTSVKTVKKNWPTDHAERMAAKRAEYHAAGLAVAS